MIHRENSDSVAVLRMEHGKANAVDTDLFAAVLGELDAVEASGARALVLTGTGSMFSAGVNLFRVLEGGRPYLEEFLPMLAAVIRRLFTFPRPIVAAINGHAIAGGCILAAACDHRIMNREKGRIGVTELLVGVPFPAYALEALRFLMPERRLQDLVYSGRTMGAAEALEIGLVDATAASGELLEDACRAAVRMGGLSAEAFAVTKRLIRQPTLERMERMAAETDAELLELWSHPEAQARIRAFLEQTVGKK